MKPNPELEASCLTCCQLRDSDVWVGVIASHVYWGVWGLLQVVHEALVVSPRSQLFMLLLLCAVRCVCVCDKCIASGSDMSE